MKKYLFLLAILLVCLFFYFARIALSLHFMVKFASLRPFGRCVPVYYKGIKVGKVLSRNHTKDYNHAVLTIVVYPHDLKLQEGTIAYLKQHKLYNYFKQDYLDLVFPKEGGSKYLSNNSVIEGRATIDTKEYGANQNLDEIEEIKNNLAESAENLNYALGGLSELFQTLNDIAAENKQNLHKATTNFSNASSNFSNVTKKFDNSIDQNKLNSTFNSISSATLNFDTASHSINSNTKSLDATISNLEDITSDAAIITKSVKKTLSKRCGGFRLFFGRTVTGACP